MNGKKRFKQAAAGIAGLMMLAAGRAEAEEQASGTACDPAPQKDEEQSYHGYSKEDLIKSLRGLHRNPTSYKTVSAMCYDMAMLSGDTDFVCPLDGTKSVYQRQSDAGELVDNIEYIERLGKYVPYKISVDSSALCSSCGKDKPKELTVHVKCFDCGADFTWPVKNQYDISMLQWLWLRIPITELDEMQLPSRDGTEKSWEETVRHGAEYIRDHVFCPDCRKKIELDEK